MKTFKYIILLSIFFIQGHAAASQKDEKANIEDIQRRVVNLEDYKSNIDNLSKIEIQKAKDELKKEFDTDYENVRNMFYLILLLGIPTALGTLIMVFWGFNRKIKNLINEKIETIVEHKREDIIKLINNQEFERSLKNSKTLLVISANEDAQEEIKRMMHNFKFKNLIFRVNKTFQNIPEHDLVIFNNCDDKLTQQDVNEFMDSITDDDTYFVTFTPTQMERNPRLNFANSKFTLYHNILTTLSFVEAIKHDE